MSGAADRLGRIILRYRVRCMVSRWAGRNRPGWGHKEITEEAQRCVRVIEAS